MKRMFDYKELNDKLNRAIPLDLGGGDYIEDHINPLKYPNGTIFHLTGTFFDENQEADLTTEGLLEIKKLNDINWIEEYTIISSNDEEHMYQKWGRSGYNDINGAWHRIDNKLDNNINFDYPYATGTCGVNFFTLNTKLVLGGLYLIEFLGSDNTSYGMTLYHYSSSGSYFGITMDYTGNDNPIYFSGAIYEDGNCDLFINETVDLTNTKVKVYKLA